MARGRSYAKSNADGFMRGEVVKEVGALLDHITYSGVYPFNFRWRIQSQNRVK